VTGLAVAAAAALGAVARFLVDRTVQRRYDRSFPLGTLVVNVSGAFLLGLLTGVVGRHLAPSLALTVLGTGLIGSYTTFSTYAWESVLLLEGGARAEGVINLAGSLVLGMIAGAAGLGLAALAG
jgi:CrcB protein